MLRRWRDGAKKKKKEKELSVEIAGGRGIGGGERGYSGDKW